MNLSCSTMGLNGTKFTLGQNFLGVILLTLSFLYYVPLRRVNIGWWSPSLWKAVLEDGVDQVLQIL